MLTVADAKVTGACWLVWLQSLAYPSPSSTHRQFTGGKSLFFCCSAMRTLVSNERSKKEILCNGYSFFQTVLSVHQS